MAKTQTLHVVPSDGAWAIKAKSGKTTWRFDTKRDAIDEARKRVSNNVRIIIHGKSGQIFQSITAPRELTYKVVRDAVRSSRSVGVKRNSKKASMGKRASASKKTSHGTASKSVHAKRP